MPTKPKGNKKGSVYKKHPDLDTRIGKYFLNKKSGMTKSEAQRRAGFPDVNHPARIENTKTYKALEKHFYADELQKIISLQEIAQAHAENIMQDQDRGARNTAIKMAMDKIEPEDLPRDEEKVIIIMRGAKTD